MAARHMLAQWLVETSLQGRPWLTSAAAQHAEGAQHRAEGRGTREMSAVLGKVLAIQQRPGSRRPRCTRIPDERCPLDCSG